MQDREATAVEDCVAEGDMSESGGASNTAQVDDIVINFDTNVDADMDDPPNSSSSATHSAVGQDDTGISDEAAVRRDRRMRRLQRELGCTLGNYWKKPKLPRGLECNLGNYWTKPVLRRKTNRA